MDPASNGILCSLKKGTSYIKNELGNGREEPYDSTYLEDCRSHTHKNKKQNGGSKELEVHTGSCFLMDLEFSFAR